MDDLYVKQHNDLDASKSPSPSPSTCQTNNVRFSLSLVHFISPSTYTFSMGVCVSAFFLVLFGMFHIHYTQWWAVCKRADKKRNHCDRIEHFFLAIADKCVLFQTHNDNYLVFRFTYACRIMHKIP